MNYPPPPPPGQGDPNQPPPQQPPGGYTPPPTPPPAQPAYGGQPAYGAPAPAGPQTAGKATTSLVLGIVSLFLCGLLSGIPAIFLGISARKDIRQSNGRLTGDGLAMGGVVTGIIGTLLSIVGIVFFIIAIAAGGSAVKQINDAYNSACASYSADSDPNNDCP